MIYGYARVSARTQLKGNSLEEQKTELKKNEDQERDAGVFKGRAAYDYSCEILDSAQSENFTNVPASLVVGII